MSIGNWYRVGTVSVQNGNVNVVGTNTFWTTQANPGDRFTVDGENWYEIVTITDDTHMAIQSVGGSGAFAGATAANLPYAIDRNFNNALSGGLAAQVAALLAQFQAGANGPLSGLFQNGSAATPGIAFLNEASTGLFRPAAGIAALAVQGSEFLRAVGTVNGVPAMLGLGTAAPGQMLDLAASNSALWGVRMINASAGTAARAGFIASNGTQTLNVGVNGANFTANGALAPSRGFVEGSAGIDFASGATAGNAFTWGAGAGYPTRMAMDYQGNLTLSGGSLTFADGSTLGADGFNSEGTYTTALEPYTLANTINWTGASSATFKGFRVETTMSPQAAITGSMSGGFFNFILNNTSNGVAAAQAITLLINQQSAYAGVCARGSNAVLQAPSSLGATNPFTQYNGIFFNGTVTNGNGTAGAISNNGIMFGAVTPGAGIGGTVSNAAINLTLPSGSGAGTTNNFGLYLQGNGGAGGAGVTNNFSIYSPSTAPAYFAGNLVVGSSSMTSSAHYIVRIVAADTGQPIVRFGNDTVSPVVVYSTSVTGYSAANAALKVGKDNVTGYSIRPGGAIASPGADYAEYRQLISGLYGAVAKGALLGYDVDGLMTNMFSNVVGRVLPKSTDPSYVGGDTWGTEAAILAAYGVAEPGDAPAEVAEPVAPVVVAAPGVAPVVVPAPGPRGAPAEIAAYDAYLAAQEAHAEAAEAYATYQKAVAFHPQWQASYAAYQGNLAAYEARLAAFNTALDTERKKWDRIALCGVVPVNLGGLTSADVGKYLVPCAAADGTITATAVARKDLTLGQYIDSFGTIERIGSDGRPLVNVKNG